MATAPENTLTVEQAGPDLAGAARRLRDIAFAIDPVKEPIGSWGWTVLNIENGHVADIFESYDDRADAEWEQRRFAEADPDGRFVVVQLLEPSD